jgi:hypothetical protein
MEYQIPAARQERKRQGGGCDHPGGADQGHLDRSAYTPLSGSSPAVCLRSGDRCAVTSRGGDPRGAFRSFSLPGNHTHIFVRVESAPALFHHVLIETGIQDHHDRTSVQGARVRWARMRGARDAPPLAGVSQPARGYGRISYQPVRSALGEARDDREVEPDPVAGGHGFVDPGKFCAEFARIVNDQLQNVSPGAPTRDVAVTG